MRRESETKNGFETGGVLAGFVDSKLNVVVVTAASGPGPKAIHTPTTFNRDREFCQAFLNQLVTKTRGVVDFVGEWHKHREPDPYPSSVDRDTYCNLAADPNCHTNLPVVLIVGTDHSRRIGSDDYSHVNGFVFGREGHVHRPVQALSEEAYQDLR